MPSGTHGDEEFGAANLPKIPDNSRLCWEERTDGTQVHNAAQEQRVDSRSTPGTERRAADARRHRCIELGESVVSSVRSELGPKPMVSYFGFPTHRNVGDSLLAVGALRVLDQIGASVVSITDSRSYDPRRAHDLPEEAIAVFQGGGNFGDLWPTEHRHRLDALEVMRSHRCVFLPQSLWFDDPEAIITTREALAAAPHLTMMWRDQRSLNDARRLFPDNHSILVPDTAFGAAPLSRRTPWVGRDGATLVLERSDKEASVLHEVSLPSTAAVDRMDWDHATAVDRRLALLRRTIRGFHGHAEPTAAAISQRLYRSHARARSRAGLRLLSKYDLVITDRLHGWIMCAMAGITAYAFDTPQGKIGSLLETWFPGERNSILSAPNQVAELLGRQLRHAPGGTHPSGN